MNAKLINKLNTRHYEGAEAVLGSRLQRQSIDFPAALIHKNGCVNSNKSFNQRTHGICSITWKNLISPKRRSELSLSRRLLLNIYCGRSSEVHAAQNQQGWKMDGRVGECSLHVELQTNSLSSPAWGRAASGPKHVLPLRKHIMMETLPVSHDPQ